MGWFYRQGDCACTAWLPCQPSEHIGIAGLEIGAAGASLLYLPPYSPDLNPIEQVIAKLKHLLRKSAERTKEAVWRRIGSLLDQFTPQECENYIRNAGYGSA